MSDRPDKDARDTRDWTPDVEAEETPPAPGEVTTETSPEVEDLKRQLAEKHDRLLRALAEVDNVKRRTQREREEYVRYANEGLVRDLLPILDNLDRALEAARATREAAKVVEGVALIQRELLKVLERVGVTRYSALGERFDPNRHEATGRVVSVNQAPDTVVAELTPGYVLNGRVLRPAQVVVAAAPDEDAA
jgi:molecular chaperone GrpE